MAQTGYTPILIYASGTPTNVPLAANLTSSASGAELAINYADGRLFYKDSGGTVQVLAVRMPSGILPIANGGTNATATPTAGAVAYGTGTAYAFTSAGTSNQVLISNGSSAPSWSNLSSLGVTSLSFGTTGLTPSTATQGAITVAGTLATTNGGTGLTSFTANGVVYASSTSALTTGSALTFTGTRLGIGEASPASALTVKSGNGDQAIFNNAGERFTQLTLQNNGTSKGALWVDNTNSLLELFGYSGMSLTFSANGSEQMRLTSTGLGIGTSSPASKLHIESASAESFRIGYSSTKTSRLGTTSAGDLQVFAYDSAVGYKNILLAVDAGTSAGNVGIGTSSPLTKLDIKFATDKHALFLASSSYSNGADLVATNDAGSEIALGLGGSTVRFYTGASEQMRLTSTGLGIGTSSPTNRLTIASPAGGSATVSGNFRSFAFLYADQSGSPGFRLGYNQSSNNAIISGVEQGGGAGGGVEFWSFNGSAWGERARIDTTGRLGVGSTFYQSGSPAGSISFPQGASVQTGSFGRAWNPAQQIGQVSVSGLYGMAHTYLAYYDSGWKSLGGGTASAFTMDEGVFSFCNTNGVGGSGSALTWTTRMMIGTNGRVGIGTVSPQTLLHLNTAEAAADVLRITNGTLDLNLGVNNTAGGSYLFEASNNALRFGTGNSERMRILSGGDICIATTTGIGVGAKVNIFGGGNVLHVQSSNAAANNIVSYNSSGTATFAVSNGGAVSKTSGSFKIDHPLPDMEKTHFLVHSFVEGPRADNIYRGEVVLVQGKATVNLDAVSKMTEGTFVLLNRDVQSFTSNESDWDAVRGKVIGNILTVECQNANSTAIVSWMVIGERQDKHMYETDWTDENGHVIVEPRKP